MYCSYFGLKDRPFRITPDPEYLFMTQKFEAAFDSINYAIRERAGFMVLTGEVGTGKTTLTRQLLSTVGEEVETALLINPLLSVPELLRAINIDFGNPVDNLSVHDQLQTIERYLVELHSAGKTALVVIDESQNLGFEALEMIRMLTNIETEREKLLQILLVGQPELDEKLRRHDLRQLRQRIALRVELGSLTLLEMIRYISHRLQRATGNTYGRIYFDGKSYREIYRLTSGSPRLVNMLCDRILIAAFVEDTQQISRGLVRKAYDDMRIGRDRGRMRRLLSRLRLGV